MLQTNTKIFPEVGGYLEHLAEQRELTFEGRKDGMERFYQVVGTYRERGGDLEKRILPNPRYGNTLRFPRGG